MLVQITNIFSANRQYFFYFRLFQLSVGLLDQKKKFREIFTEITGVNVYACIRFNLKPTK